MEKVKAIHCTPAKPITHLRSNERTLGRLMHLHVPAKTDPAAIDLAADLFWRFYLHTPQAEPRTPRERNLNAALIRWVEAAPGWESGRASTIANLATASIAAQGMFTVLSSDSIWSEILKSQEELEKEMERLRQLQEEKAEQDRLEREKEKNEASDDGSGGDEDEEEDDADHSGAKGDTAGDGDTDDEGSLFERRSRSDEDEDAEAGEDEADDGKSEDDEPLDETDEGKDEGEGAETDTDEGEEEGEGDKLDQQIAEQAAKVELLADSLDEQIAAMNGNPMAQTALSAATTEASEEAGQLASEMAGWGFGPGSPEFTDPAKALAFLEQHQDDIREIARLTGRLRGIAIQSRHSRVTTGFVPTDVTLTRDIAQLFPAQRAALRHDAPAALRALTVAQWASHGLLGWQLSGDAKESGPFVGATDVSGSLTGTPNLVAKALVLGIAQTAKNEGRAFELFTFSTSNCPKCYKTLSYDAALLGEMVCPFCKEHVTVMAHATSIDPLDQLMRWAGHFIGGGTDFELALNTLMRRIKELGQSAKSTDALFVSDGEAAVSFKMLEIWRKFKEETASRLIYVEVGTHGMRVDRDQNPQTKYYTMPEIADVVYRVPNLNLAQGESLAESIAQAIR